jgi:hypothetical protein
MRVLGIVRNLWMHIHSEVQRARRKGQSLAIFAISFLGLAVTMGLAIDIGALYVQYDHLRRAVDAAALSAAAQYRQGTSSSEMELAAKEFLALNNIDPDRLTVHVWNCEQVHAGVTGIEQDFIDACPPQSALNQRKLVWVQASVDAQMFFLSLININTVEMTSNAIAEGAPLDLILVLDTSSSMTYDAACGDGDNDDPDDDNVVDDGCGELDLPGARACGPVPYEGNGVDDDNDGIIDDGCPAGPNPVVFPPVAGAFADDYYRDEAICNASAPLAGFPPGAQTACQPFEDMRYAAKEFVGQMFSPFDHVGLITFSQTATMNQSLNTPNSIAQALTALDLLRVSADPSRTVACAYHTLGDPSGCTSTNIGGGLKRAAIDFSYGRDDALWVAVLLTDGAANASDDVNGDGHPNDYCPSSTWPRPFCRDSSATSRHVLGDPETNYDTSDFAYDWVDFLGLLPTNGQGVVLFSIGLGPNTVCTGGVYDPPVGSGLPGCAPPYTQGDANAGEVFLRHLSDVGDNGIIDAPLDPCYSGGVPRALGTSCGNYYFAPTGADLLGILQAIAYRIFTRLT